VDRARAICAFRSRVSAAWPKVRVESVTASGPKLLLTGNALSVVADVQLGELRAPRRHGEVDRPHGPRKHR
jgi:hypothetical protein